MTFKAYLHFALSRFVTNGFILNHGTYPIVLEIGVMIFFETDKLISVTLCITDFINVDFQWRSVDGTKDLIGIIVGVFVNFIRQFLDGKYFFILDLHEVHFAFSFPSLIGI